MVLEKNKYFIIKCISVVLAVFFILSGCSNKQQITIASHVWPGYEFMFLARNLDYLDPQLISLHESNSASETLQLLKEGKVEGGALTFDEVIRARQEGINLRVVLVFNISAGADVILAKPTIKNFADLKGKSIGVEIGAVGSIMLHQAINKSNLRMDDIKIINATIDQHLKIWNEGLIDAVITYEPEASKIIEQGGYEIFTSREAPNLIVDVLAFREDALKNDKAISHIIESHFKAQKHFNQQHEDSTYRMASRLGIPANQVNNVYRGLVLPDYQNNLRLLSGKSPALLESAKMLSTILQTNVPANQQSIDLNHIIDDSFLLKVHL